MKTKHPKPYKSGNTIIPIYRYTNKGYDEYKVVDTTSGKRVFHSCASLADAKKKAKEVAKVRTLKDEQPDVLILRDLEKSCYVCAVDTLKPFGKSLDVIAAEYAEIMGILDGANPIEAARYYVKKHPTKLPSKTVAEVVAEMIAAKQAEKLSQNHIDDLEYRLERGFAKDVQMQIASVTGQQIAAWLNGLGLSNKSYNNFRIAVNTLFNFAKERSYLPKDHDEMGAVKPRKVARGKIEIFTPNELAKLLTVAQDELVPFLAIGAFAGLRSSEIEHLDWKDVKWDTGFIVVGDERKTGRRAAPMVDNLRKWLEPYKKEKGKINVYGNVTNQLLKLATAAGVQWKQNALRHSFVSYRVADLQNLNQVALEAGHDVRTLLKYYRELVTPAEAKVWFSIAPGTATNIIQHPVRMAI
jgi:integrase